MYLDNYINHIQRLCKKNRVKYLFAFGSVLTENFSEYSDIDLLVEIDINDPIDYADKYFTLKFDLEDLFRRPVDLLENRALKNPFLIKGIDSSKKLIYAA